MGNLDPEFIVEILSDIYSRFPHVRELVFHGHELRESAPLRTVSGLKTIISPYALNRNNYVVPDQWINIDLFSCTAEELAEIMLPYETGMLYIPSEGTSSSVLGNLIIAQTTGLGSLFQPKTYKNFLCMDVFVGVTNRFYQLRHFQT